MSKRTSRATNVVWQSTTITKEMRENRNGHRGVVIWMTGLSGAGKSTLALALEKSLFDKGCHVYVLDGDNVRHGLNNDLGFSPEEREENIRRVGEVAKLFADAGNIVVTAFISPYRADRRHVREIMTPSDFVEVYIKCELETCISRDPKGLYARALAGEIEDFTGIAAPYEEPEHAEIVIETTLESVTESTDKLLEALRELDVIELHFRDRSAVSQEKNLSGTR